MQLLVLFTVLLTLTGRSAAKGSWGYGKTHGQVYGPADWGHVSKDCDGRHQSPVDIVASCDDDDDRGDHELRVRFYKFLGSTSGTITNNGHSPTFTVNKGGAKLRNPINGQQYKLAQLHFHFGCDDSVGSEHTVNRKSYPGEMHLVFFNTKYSNIGTAASKSDGLSVIGVFLKKAHWSSWQLRKIASKVADTSAEGTTTKEFSVDLAILVPGLTTGDRDYYSYKGSLTTPGCYESVSWLVLKDPINADNGVFRSFRKLHAKHGYKHGKMCNNFRPTQSLNGRLVTLHDD